MANLPASYLALYQSGELQRRAELLEARLAACDICPRGCGVNRLAGQTAYCYSGRLPVLASFCAHRGEEPVLSGTRGSGTLFFAHCNMRCVYCQNYQISQSWPNPPANQISTTELAERMLELQARGCHNINLVSPSHYIPQILRALVEAVPHGLHLPLVYNTSGYDSLETLRALEGVVDIYLPDLRYASEECARHYSDCADYVAQARAAVKEMYRQVGDLVLDEQDIARRGLIVRLLILPNGQADVPESLKWLAREVSPAVTVSVMSQYYPVHKAADYPLVSRQISYPEYREVAKTLEALGMENGWLQEMDAPGNYRPDFSRREHPFEV